MTRSRIIVAIVAGTIAFAPAIATATTPPPTVSHGSSSPVAVWLVMGCAASIIWAAWIANITQNRELTQAEANFCGFGFLLNARPQ